MHSKRSFNRPPYLATIAAAVLSWVGAAVCYAEPEMSGTPEELRGFLYPSDRIVTIFADAELKAYSDQAIVSLLVTTEAKQLAQAMKTNSEARAEIRRQLKRADIAESAIKSSNFSSTPEYGWFGDKPSSYKVVNRMAITITESNQLEVVAAVADSLKTVEVSDTAFEHTQKDEFNAQVKADALAKVMQQKSVYEQTLGVKLEPVGIRDSHIRQMATRGASKLSQVMTTAKLTRAAGYSEATDQSVDYESPAPEASFDEVKYEANLSVDFKLISP